MRPNEIYMKSLAINALEDIASEKSPPVLIELAKNVIANYEREEIGPYIEIIRDALGAAVQIDPYYSVPELMSLLKTNKTDDNSGKSAIIRQTIVEAAGGTFSPVATPVIVEGLKDPHFYVLASAAAVARNFQSEELTEQLIKIASDKHEFSQVKRDAIRALGNVHTAEVFSCLVENLRESPSSAVRAAAAEALGRAGFQEAVPYLKRSAKKDSEASVRTSALQSLKELGHVSRLDLWLERLKSLLSW
ncbi:MAG: hypothetical protein D6719_04205 [Candidatus Dadabacteria bacterium]|nr:MAG: hypothetical protein D6719_04205 [Candidatus Dadabacteria bacterium]